ncbi:MAG: lipoyl(octanoyl) transferase LipB [Deltaproteobacteria bacterium]
MRSHALSERASVSSGEPRILDVGRVPFEEAAALQKKIVAEVLSGWGAETLIVCEHPAVITYGRRSDTANILVSPERLSARGIDVRFADRGGDVTFHGPGQIVLYPVLDLRRRARDLHFYLRQLEFCVINALRQRYGLNAYRKQDLTGVWVGPFKVASIGIGVRNWVTYHGVAVNVATDMAGFTAIRPCGMDVRMAALAQFFRDEDLPLQEVKACLLESFREVFFKTMGGRIS